MDPITLAALIGGAGSLIGGIGGLFANTSAQDRAKALQDQSMQNWLNINVPDPSQQKLIAQKFISTGQLDPKLEQAIQQNPTEFKNVIPNAGLVGAQQNALSQLEDLGHGGLRLQDQASLQDAMEKGQVQDKANREAISAGMARRGLGGSGFDFASQLEAQQSGANRDSRNALSTAASAQDRALQAIQQSGQLATQYRTQDTNEQSQKAQAQDAINRFNASNTQNVMNNNVNTQNQAQAANLAQQQKTSDQNTNLTNQTNQYNSKLMQDYFNNQMALAKGKSDVQTAQANAELKQGAQTGNIFGNIGSAIAGGASAFGKKNSNIKSEDDEEE